MAFSAESKLRLRASWAVFCGLLCILYHVGNFALPTTKNGSGSATAAVYFPHLSWKRDPAGRPLAHLDLDELDLSIRRLKSSARLREFGNSLRVWFGEIADWIFVEHQNRTTLFLQYDVGVSEGLTPLYQEAVRGAIQSICDLNSKLKQEHWKLLFVPVPPKVSICRDSIKWPLLRLDKYSRHPIVSDATDQVCDRLFAGLQAGGVDFIDLRPDFRRETERDPTAIFPAAESHWRGRGIQIAADRVTAKLNALYGLQTDRKNLETKSLSYYCDLARALELSPIIPTPLSPILEINDRVSFDHKVPEEPPRSLLALAGTSYSGQYSWSPRAGFAATLDAMLPSTRVISFAEAGHGSLRTMATFLAKRTEIYKQLAYYPDHLITANDKYLVWEFPIRDLQVFVGKVFPFSRENDTPPDSGDPVAVETPNGLETLHDKSFFWLNDKPVAIRFREANAHRLLLLSWMSWRGPDFVDDSGPTLEFSVDDTRLTSSTREASRNVMKIPIPENIGEITIRCTNSARLTPNRSKNRDPRTLLLAIADLKAKFVDSTE